MPPLAPRLLPWIALLPLAAGCSSPSLAVTDQSAPADLATPHETDSGAQGVDGGGDAAVDAAMHFADGSCNGHLPNPALTPGALCTPTNPDFAGYRYAEKIAYCNRNVPTLERDAIGASYGVPQADFAKYEFDHYYPLSIGGSDDPKNLWPQIRPEATEKDSLEQTVFNGVSAGTMTQAQAMAMIRAWRPTGVTCP